MVVLLLEYNRKITFFCRSKLTDIQSRILSFSQLIFRNLCLLHDSPLQTRFQVVAAMNWHRYPQSASGSNKNVMAASDTGKRPALLFKQRTHRFAADSLHFRLQAP
jgi:hypothetical protein